jgi:dynein heavy chain, axonemal
LKTFKTPPEAIKTTLKACCLLVNPNPKEKMKDESGLKMITDWWSASLKMVSDSNFIKNLKEFDKENVEEKLIVNLGNFLHAEENVELLKPHNVANASKACECIIMWVNGIYNYYWVNKRIKPKKIMLTEALSKVGELEKALRLK